MPKTTSARNHNVSGPGPMTLKEKTRIEDSFGKFINKGQVRYLKSGHLDVMETERRGVYFTEPFSGKRFFDCFTSAGCFNVGRRNPVILEALDQSLDALDMGSPHLISPHKVALAKKLTALAPGDLNRLFFASGGGDAVDGAIKLALGATGRHKVISTIKAYHGHTGYALSANGKEHYRQYFEPLAPGFRFVPLNDARAMEAMADHDTAAIILEPIQGEAGIFVAEDEYLRGLRTLCDRLGIMLIFDEIQTGMARTGKLFACEHAGVTPDILLLGKSIGGGLHPNAAVLYRDVKPLVDYVEKNPFFHQSWGGADPGCRTSLATLQYIEKHGLCENAEKQGRKLKEALTRLREENPRIIRAVRGRGLMIGIEYIHEFMGPMMTDALAKNNVFAAYSGNDPRVMRFMPPLIVTGEEMDVLIAAIRNAVKAMKMILPLALPAAKIPPILKLLNSEKVQTSLFSWIRKVEDLVERLMGRFR
ncbi:MAG: aspartate aminotransferase family protein [Desulfobacterales bacterium]|nr:aspartate aminotransferase family protein [Desulfobacterales bacterium]